MTQLFNLMIEVMVPLALLVAAGAVWPLIFRDTPVEAMSRRALLTASAGLPAPGGGSPRPPFAGKPRTVWRRHGEDSLDSRACSRSY